MPKQIRVNIRSNATSKPKKAKRNGRDVIVVSSATLPDNIVMNDIQYPAQEIANSYATLERAPAPLGHPEVNGKFVSASDPEGINRGWCGAWNENVRQENGRVLLDKVIDVEVANRTEAGRELMEAINKGEPIHTSTGLLCNIEDAPDGSEFKHIARNIWFDHDAILLNEHGAATPDQGVGMMVNRAGEEIEVVNSIIADDAMRDLEWATDWAVRAVERLERASMIDRIKTAIMEAIQGSSQRETTSNEKGADEMADDKQLEALSERVNGLEESIKGIGGQIAEAVTNAVKPLTDNLAEMKANQEAKDKAELADLVKTIVKANILDEEAAGELTLNAARKLAAKAEPGKAAGLNNAGAGGGEGADVYDFNEVMGLQEVGK